MPKPKYFCDICLDTGFMKCPVCKGKGINPDPAGRLVYGEKCIASGCHHGFTKRKCHCKEKLVGPRTKGD